MLTTLFSNRTTDGSSSEVSLAQEAWTGGSINEREAIHIPVQVSGTFDGCTVTIEGSIDGTTFSALKDANGNSIAFTAAGLVVMVLAGVTQLRATVSSAGASTSVTVKIA